MTEDRLPDCRPPRRDASLTSAAFHPELMHGDLVMRPTPQVRWPPAQQSIVASWSRGVLATCALVIASLLAAPHLYAIAVNAQQARHTTNGAAICMPWDERARTALATLVQSRSNGDLLQVSDAVFRIRRARRNCQMGWVALACQDFDAVIRGVPGLSLEITQRSLPCGS